MTQEQIAAELEAIKALLKSRGADISYACVQYWSTPHSTPHWDCKISLNGEPDIKSDHQTSALMALVEVERKAASYRPPVDRLREILGVVA